MWRTCGGGMMDGPKGGGGNGKVTKGRVKSGRFGLV